MIRVVIITALGLVLSGCGVGHIKDYTPKRREYEPPTECDRDLGPLEPGQLWTTRSKNLFRDIRAYQICDILRVDIVERSSATNNAETRVGSDGALNFGADALSQLRVRGPAGVDPERLLEVTSRLRSERAGETSREGDVTFSISATVKKVLTNGNLFLEGETVVLVNSEENHFYVSGVARPEDVLADNSIRSSRLADAHIEFTGRGVIAESQEPGWLARLWNWIINPL